MDKQSKIGYIKKWLTTGNLLNGLFFAVVIIIHINPSAKALLIRGLMTVGLFQPEVSTPTKTQAPVADISFRDADGNAVSLLSLRGKVVFINFWATWCPPCIAELPSINALHQHLISNKDIVFLLADADNDFKKSLPFIEKHRYNLPVYNTLTPVPEAVFGNALPTTVVINKQGQMVFRHEGAAEYTNAKFVDYLKKLAAEYL